MEIVKAKNVRKDRQMECAVIWLKFMVLHCTVNLILLRDATKNSFY